MIVGDSFVWLHLPKTGGTTMNALFRGLGHPGLRTDADDTPDKHDSIRVREARTDWRAGTRQRFVTLRRLQSWLVSDWQHKRRHMGLPDLDFAPVRCGLFYSLRLGGTWVAADWWLAYFEVDGQTTALRLEHLRDDLNRHLLGHLPEGTPAFDVLPRENQAPDAADDRPNLEAADLARIRAVNPRWAALERQLYGPGG